MNMKKNRKELLEALTAIKGGLASKEMIEQSTSFVFQEGNVYTYNDEISVSHPLDLDFEGAIQAKELLAYLNKVKAEEITIEISESQLKIRAGRSKVGLNLQEEVLLPIDEIGKIKKWNVLPENFIKAVNFTMGACSSDLSQPILLCVHIKGRLIEGTDSYRIAQFNLEEEIPIPEFLIPASSCMKLTAFKPIKIAEGEGGWVHFKNKNNSIMSCRLFEDSYVNTQAFMKRKGDKVSFPKEMVEIIDRAGVISKKESRLDEAIMVTIEKGKISIKAESEVGWFEEKARTDFVGEKMTFTITPYLLRDILGETNKGLLSSGSLLFIGKNWKYVTLLKK